jgi:tRNA(fMet)-specific endonuclease VapC
VASRYLLDTNVLSEPKAQKPKRAVLERLRKHASVVATAAPCIHELLFGAERLPASARRRAYDVFVQEWVEAIPILPYDLDAARWHARERARLAGLGKTPAFVDGQIAAIAATQNLCLVTRNVRDFRSFQGLRLENWFVNA